ncbi:PHP domain-containing protein [Clostridium sp. CX1]|uniref:PHP domain-containing protein n=1 Tax=Clostridium tanneri TaxID=3037988 RepID=A0ABU4JQT9_9CLOT|nr:MULTISPECIES: PHP domain-containing protein [unclassified Clostridium]MCT8977435.1 PHP domain-containing protein [Clostridium sp. CX1]MDW8800522.1 PHP domain-containing protein [Clostridium sp. A1-XYC3]
MIIDTHIHESKYSLDSEISLKDIVKRAKEIGLDGVCITDHESNEIMEEAHEYSKSTGFLILVGAEILTYQGDILVFGLKDLPKKMLPAKELIELVHKNKGVAISAHPYRNNNRGMGDYIKVAKSLGLNGVESFNGSTEPHQNLHAYSLATELNIPSIGSSDAHVIENIGKYATVFPNGIRDERDLIDAIKAGNVCPAMFKNGHYKHIDMYKEVENNLKDKIYRVV